MGKYFPLFLLRSAGKSRNNFYVTIPLIFALKSIINDEIRDAKEPESEYYTAQLLTVFSENEVVSRKFDYAMFCLVNVLFYR